MLSLVHYSSGVQPFGKRVDWDRNRDSLTHLNTLLRIKLGVRKKTSSNILLFGYDMLLCLVRYDWGYDNILVTLRPSALIHLLNIVFSS